MKLEQNLAQSMFSRLLRLEGPLIFEKSRYRSKRRRKKITDETFVRSFLIELSYPKVDLIDLNFTRNQKKASFQRAFSYLVLYLG